jgi:hypothetical protein
VLVVALYTMTDLEMIFAAEACAFGEEFVQGRRRCRVRKKLLLPLAGTYANRTIMIFCVGQLGPSKGL